MVDAGSFWILSFEVSTTAATMTTEQMIDACRAAWIDFENPSREFIGCVEFANPYLSLLAEFVKRGYGIEDLTDTNYDTSFTYGIVHNEQIVALLLSFVAPVATVSRYRPEFRDYLFLDLTAVELTELEAAVVHTAQEHGIYFPSIEQLEVLIPLRLETPDPEDNATTLWHGLFGEVEQLPWKPRKY